MFNFCFLLALSSCSFFIKKLDTELVKKEAYKNNIPEVATYCPMNTRPKIQLINNNSFSQGIYQDFFVKNPQLDFFDHFALWSLLQFAIRPDQSSPSSRFQVIFQLKDENHYFDFFSEQIQNQFPTLFGIELILKKFNKNRSLEYYASIIDKQFTQKQKVEKNFESFLITNKEKIKEDPALGLFFIRGTEVLKENERLPKLNFQRVVQHYRQFSKDQKIIVNTSLNSFTTEFGQSGKCNYDFNLYSNSIFLIDKMVPASNLFGLATSSDAFMASSSQKLDTIKPINDFPLFDGESKVRSSAVCIIENRQNLIWTFSNLSRDPGQHLFHLVRYGLARAQSTPEVDTLIRHSRHLFLSDPVRLIIESNRSPPEQIEHLLKLNLPIYNAEKLGNVWAFTSIQGTNRFIIDDRNPGSFSCK